MIEDNSSTKSIYLDSDDEITTVIDKLDRASVAEINLVIPRGAVVLRSIINLQLLKKAVLRQNKRVTIITKDENGQILAQKADLPVKNSVRGELLKLQEVVPKSDEHITIKEYSQDSSEPVVENNKSHIMPAGPGLRAMVEAERAARLHSVDAKYSANNMINKSDSNEMSVRPARTLPRRAFDQRVSHPEADTKASVKTDNIENKLTRRLNGRANLGRKVRLLPKWPWKIIGMVTGSLVILVFLVITFGFAKATVSLHLKKDSVSLDSEVVIDTKPDQAKNELTGRIISTEKEEKKTITPSGKKEVGNKARGTVQVSNTYSDKALTLGADTTLVAAGGQLFGLASAVSVPGASIVKGKTVAGVVSAGIIASKFGEEYNLGPTSFTINGLSTDQKNKVSAKSDSPTSGGTKKTVTILTSEDLNNAKKNLEKIIRPKLDQQIADLVNDDEELLDQAKQIKSGSIDSDVAIGGEAKEAHLKLKMSAKAIVDKPEEIRKKGLELLAQSLKDNQELMPKSKSEISWSFIEIDFKQNRLVVKTNITQEATYSLDERNIVSDIIGLSKDKARETLENIDEIDKAMINLVPVWRRSLPRNYDRIKIRYN